MPPWMPDALDAVVTVPRTWVSSVTPSVSPQRRRSRRSRRLPVSGRRVSA